MLENLSFQNDERIAALELSLQEAQMIAEDSDRKYDEVYRREYVGGQATPVPQF